MWTQWLNNVSIVIITRGFTIPHLLTLPSICHEPSSLIFLAASLDTARPSGQAKSTTSGVASLAEEDVFTLSCDLQSCATLCVNWEWTGGWSRAGPKPGPGGRGGGGGVGEVVRPPPPLQAEGPHFGHPLSQTFDKLWFNVWRLWHNNYLERILFVDFSVNYQPTV